MRITGLITGKDLVEACFRCSILRNHFRLITGKDLVEV